jgi:DNA-binding transcriptional LysR family regulator
MADRLTGMDVFVKAIRLGGISAAARDLHMSPAMAAKHLDALEARLGTTLVQRSTRRLSLTEAGTDYFEKAERILMEIGEAESGGIVAVDHRQDCCASVPRHLRRSAPPHPLLSPHVIPR